MTKLINERCDVIPALARAFRKHGFDAASLSVITKETGLGKGSLYHFFPEGKEEMARAVLTEVDTWFELNVFAPLREEEDAAGAIADMFDKTEAYFYSGQRVCLFGVLALVEARERFKGAVRCYFAKWQSALTQALVRDGCDADEAEELSEDAVSGIQGALVLCRALDDPQIFGRVLRRWKERLMIELDN